MTEIDIHFSSFSNNFYITLLWFNSDIMKIIKMFRYLFLLFFSQLGATKQLFSELRWPHFSRKWRQFSAINLGPLFFKQEHYQLMALILGLTIFFYVNWILIVLKIYIKKHTSPCLKYLLFYHFWGIFFL